MRKLFLHVGHGKTGSSFIQSSLALSQNKLLKKGIDYPETQSLSHAKNGKITSGNGTLLTDVLKQFYKPKASNVLLSSEVLFHEIIDGKFDEFFSKPDPNLSISILLFKRDPVEHAASSYQQSIKRGGATISIEEMFSKYKHPQLVAEFIDHIKNFPNVTLHLYNYSQCRSDILSVIENWLGVSQKYLEIPKVGNVNRSMTRSELRLQKSVNKALGKSGHLVSDVLCNELPDIKSDKVLPSVEVQKNMLQRLKDACEYVDSYCLPGQSYSSATYTIKQSDLQDDNYIFSGDQIDTITSGLTSEIVKLKNSLSKVPPKFNDAHDDINSDLFTKKIESKFNGHSADTLRDIALSFEAAGNIDNAYYFMSLAAKSRPSGKLIQKKLTEYAAKLKEV